MGKRGWIKLDRSIKDHWIWTDPVYLKAWITMIMDCNHQSKSVLIKGQLLECNRGQSLNSLQTWAIIFGRGWTLQKVRTFFELLKKEHMINTEGLKNTTRLTICNYDTYQDSQHSDNTQESENSTTSQHSDNILITTNKKVKKGNNEKNENINEDFESFRKQYPGTKDVYEVSLKTFQKHKDWELELPKLLPALGKYIAHVEAIRSTGFNQNYQNLNTWLNKKGWKREYKDVTAAETKPIQSKPNFIPESKHGSTTTA
jgi:hypothetical protein